MRAEDEARRLVERLRKAHEPDEREAALRALAALGEDARDALLEATRDADPEVRFDALYLLQAGDVRIERWVRTIAEGQPGDAGTYPSAVEAREALLGAVDAQTCLKLVRILRRYPGHGARAGRYCEVILDLLADVAGRSPSPRLAAEVCRLLELDLPEGFTELVMVLDILPRDQALPALRGVLAGGVPLARARAARLLGELLLPAEVGMGAAMLQPLLRDPSEVVRLGALEGLDAMGAPADAFVAAVPLTRDPDPTVAAEAFRILADRRLGVVREPAEAVLGSRTEPLALRLRAVTALGLLGQAGVAGQLRGLAGSSDGDRELRILSAWALGAVRAPGARNLLEQLIADDAYAQEDGLFYGLARLGSAEALAALLRIPGDGARHGRALLALGHCEGEAARAAVPVLVECAVRSEDFDQAVDGLSDLALLTPEGCPAARAALARIFLETADTARMDQLLDVLSRVGGTDDADLQARLAKRLQDLVVGGAVIRSRREQAADALARVAPALARQELARILPQVGGGSDPNKKHARNLARSLARAGDPSFVLTHALPHSREEMDKAAPNVRAFYMNNVGIDLLYARKWEEAITSFRQMLWSNPRDNIAAYNIACGHALAGRTEPALRYLRRAIRHGYEDPRHMAADSDLDSLRADPRFQRLMRSMLLQKETGQPRPQDYWPGSR